MADISGYVPPAIVQEAIRKWDDAQERHTLFTNQWEKRERAYHGIMERSAKAASWRHQLAPKLGFNLVETVVANMVEEGLRFKVVPDPGINTTLDQATLALARSESIEKLLRHEHRVDEMDSKQRPLFLCDAIGGIGIGKTAWNWHTGTVKRQGIVEQEVRTDEGILLGTVPTITEIHEQGVIHDHSTTEVVDPRDFVIQKGAKALQPWEPGGADYVFHRCWYSFEQLKSMEAAGYVKNVDLLKSSLSFADEYSERENTLWELARKRDEIEVLEYWCYHHGQVFRTIIGNRVVLLRDEEESPFWHGGFPFFSTQAMPGLFNPYGTSTVELIADLQEIIWELTNQRLDNIELINNAITIIRADMDDVDNYPFFPGAFWPVEGDVNRAMTQYQPPYQLAELTLSAEAQLKGDMQNVTSAAPFASGADSATVDNKTATGASIVMSAAQRAMAARKYQGQFGLKREASMRIKNCQQFYEGSVLVHILGKDGATAFEDIPVLELQGDFLVEMEPMSESLMRQEKRAESMQFFQIMLGAAPIMAAAQTPLSLVELVKWLGDKWDIEDIERFLSAQPAALGAMGGQGGGNPNPQAGGGINAGGPVGPPDFSALGTPNMGITSGSAVDAGSPSATGGNSLSPEMMMQRAMTYAA